MPRWLNSKTTVRGAPVEDGIELDIQYPAGRDHQNGGFSGRGRPELAGDRTCFPRRSTRLLPGRGCVEGAPFWSETPFLIDGAGCPAVYCAPGDITNCHTLEERGECRRIRSRHRRIRIVHGQLLRRCRNRHAVTSSNGGNCYEIEEPDRHGRRRCPAMWRPRPRPDRWPARRDGKRPRHPSPCRPTRSTHSRPAITKRRSCGTTSQISSTR